MFPTTADEKIGNVPPGTEPVGKNLADLFADLLFPAVKDEGDSIVAQRQELFCEHAE